jgi:hypothetical protein
MLERTYENCPSHDVKIIFGDFNAKIGQDESARPTVRIACMMSAITMERDLLTMQLH